MKIISIVLLAHLTTAPSLCQEKLDLSNDETVSKIFSEKEIEGLESMVRYVDDMVTKGKNTTNIDKAYHRFFETVAQSTEYTAPFEENAKYQFLTSLDSVQFSAVWYFDSHVDMLSVRDTVYRNLDNFLLLDIRPFSKYMDYLKKVGKKDSYFQGIQRNFEVIGGFSASDFNWFPRNHSAFDFTIPKNRLWAAIYILGMEETYEMKLDRYLNIKK